MNEKGIELDPFKGSFGSLENLADRISEVLKCPITIEDANHRLLAYSTHDDRTDPARIATIMGRRVPEKVIHSLWKDGVIPALLSTYEPVRVNQINEVGLGNRFAISIRKDQEVLGYIWALEVDHSLDSKGLEWLKKAAQAAKNQLLQIQYRRNKKEEDYQEFFWQLLTGHIKTEKEISTHFQNLQMSPPESIAVLVFQFKSEIDATMENQISYLIKTTQRIRILFHTIDRQDLILLASPLSTMQPQQDIHQFIAAFIGQMKDRFDVYSIKGSYGTVYDQFTKVEKSYKEALAVQSVKQRFAEETEHICGYQDLGIYQFIDLLLEKRQRDHFQNQSLKKLQDYDKQHKTSLLETLETYLNKDSNINDAAKTLHIHVNTLTYRLKRIAEIGEINLKDPNQKITLYIDLKINKYT